MARSYLTGIKWAVDLRAIERGEPGIAHSFVASLCTALQFMGDRPDPAWLMGTSAFAFRIFVNETMCPSAMSIFDWSRILPESVAQAGRSCLYVSRLWNEESREEEKRNEAQAAILEAVGRGVPAIVWDIADAEWGLIVGFDTEARQYQTLTWRGDPATLPFDKLGRNGIDILSVTIPGQPNGRGRQEIVRNSLAAALAHAHQKEWMKRPQYQDGLPAFELWATALEHWALLLESGCAQRIGVDVMAHAAYYARHHCAARCYARDYLDDVAGSDTGLREAAACYGEVASHLKPVWDYFSRPVEPAAGPLRALAESIGAAKLAEQRGLRCLAEYLGPEGPAGRQD